MVVGSLFYGAIRCTDVVLTELFVFTVALYMVFVYRHLFGRVHVFFDPTIALVVGLWCTVGGCDFICCLFLLCVACCLCNCS